MVLDALLICDWVLIFESWVHWFVFEMSFEHIDLSLNLIFINMCLNNPWDIIWVHQFVLGIVNVSICKWSMLVNALIHF